MTAARYIYFTKNMKQMLAFYRDTLGLTVKTGSDKTVDDPHRFILLQAGALEIALHSASKPGVEGESRNKLCFFAEDVAAARESLKAKGVSVGRLQTIDRLQLCDFKDPDNNMLQISNR
jgi:catechol 2,3-dioxygenase-like lactoylglutathione lyase family enzyme